MTGTTLFTVSRTLSRPRSDGSRTIRFVVDLPPCHRGPGWRRKAG